MPEMKRNFTSGKMNKDLDERLVPNGEYRDAMNIQVSTSEGSDVGTIQNILGNNLGCEPTVDSDFSFINSKTVGSISDEKNDALYWLVSGPSLDLGDLTNTIPTSPPIPPLYASDYIMRKTFSGCEYVLVDKHAALIDIGVGNNTSNDNQLVIPAGEISDIIIDGMEVTAIDSLGNLSNTVQVVSNESVSDFTVPAEWETSTTTTTVTKNIFSAHVGGPTMVDFCTPCPGNATNNHVYVSLSEWNLQWANTQYVAVGDAIQFTISNVNHTTTIFSLDTAYPVETSAGFFMNYVKIQLANPIPLITSSLNHVGTKPNMFSVSTTLSITSPGVPITSTTDGIIISDTSLFLADIIAGSPPNVTVPPADNAIGVSLGYVAPGFANSLNTGCVDSFTQLAAPDPNAPNWLMLVNDCSDTIANGAPQLSPPNSLCAGCDYVTFQGSALSGTANVINLNDNLNTLAGYNYLYFTKPKVLNFEHNNLITGLNIIDDMLFWTDNYTEPKK